MKNALISISILLFLGCSQPKKQAEELKDTSNTQSSEKTEKPLLLKHANQDDNYTEKANSKKNQLSKHYIQTDSLIIHTEIGETARFSKKEINEIINNHPEFFDEFIRNPDLTYHKYVNGLDFASEVGQDGYYLLYAYFLKQKNGTKKYAPQRMRLINIYSNINALFQKLQHGGTYFGHQHMRILGYAEYAVYTMPKEGELINKKYNINQQKLLYIKSLRQLIEDENAADFDTPATEKPQRLKELHQIVDKLDQLIINLFYLRRAQEFQYSNYEYY
ncbi:hypothetical protein [Pedobacter sp.]|uniref:hypothetical protein n=1 Tax=Pedobacter sp. TaxID=1411316 RepID=UPI0031E34885